ncbi:MAG: YqgE/AlgH family protein [Chthoniobacterales bacterium]
MTSRSGKPLNFTGQLLIAHPSMLDPNFRRSVLFISSHDAEEGASGVILNRPLHKQVSEIAPDDALEALADVPVYLGGPVATNELMFAALDWTNGDALTLDQNLALGEAFVPNEKRHAVRAFVGYAGWTAGQLEKELEQHAWLLQKPDPAALAPERLPKLWFEIMRSLGPWFKMLAAAPDDPSLN